MTVSRYDPDILIDEDENRIFIPVDAFNTYTGTLVCQRCRDPIRRYDCVYAIEGEIICQTCAGKGSLVQRFHASKHP